jgi:hypothetical protein
MFASGGLTIRISGFQKAMAIPGNFRLWQTLSQEALERNAKSLCPSSLRPLAKPMAIGPQDSHSAAIGPLTFSTIADLEWTRPCAFEGAYEKSMHKIRIGILQALNRDTRKLYGVQQVNVRLQAAREQRTERTINHQLIRRTLSKMKNTLEELTEEDGEAAERDGEGEDAERYRKQAKLTRQVGDVHLHYVSPNS